MDKAHVKTVQVKEIQKSLILLISEVIHLPLVHLQLVIEKTGKGMKKTGTYLSNLEGKKKIRKNIDVIILLLKEMRQ